MFIMKKKKLEKQREKDFLEEMQEKVVQDAEEPKRYRKPKKQGKEESVEIDEED